MPRWPAIVQTMQTRVGDFFKFSPREIYERCVDTCMESPRVVPLLGRRPNAGYVDVRRVMLENRDVMLSHEIALPGLRQSLEMDIEALRRATDRFDDAVDDCNLPWWQTCLLFAAPVILVAVFGGFIPALAVLFFAVIALTVLACCAIEWVFELWKCFVVVSRTVPIIFRFIAAGREAVTWGKHLEAAIEPTVWDVTRALLGEDPDSLLLPGDFGGLMSPRGSQYLVASESLKVLKGKMGQITAGAIAVCGPRGAGKSTLLESCVAEAGFGVVAQAPATYAPHDFVTSLSVQLCEKYIEDRGYSVPSFTRLSTFRRFLGGTGRVVVRALKWALFALPAVTLLAVGLADSVRTSMDYYLPGVREDVDGIKKWVETAAQETWNGAAIGAACIMLVGATVWWWLRKAAWFGPMARFLWFIASVAGSLGLVYQVVAGLLEDEEILKRASDLSGGVPSQILRLQRPAGSTLHAPEQWFPSGRETYRK